MKPNVRSGPATVVDAGMVTAFGGHPIEIALELEGGAKYSLTFLFKSARGEAMVNSQPIANGIILHCTNFDDDTGRGSAVPVMLSEIGNKLLFLHFRVFRFGKTQDRTLHYTIYNVPKESVTYSAP